MTVEKHRTFIVATPTRNGDYELAYILNNEIVAGIKIKKSDFILEDEGFEHFEKYSKETSQDTFVVDLRVAALTIQGDNKYFLVTGLTKDNLIFTMHGKSYDRFVSAKAEKSGDVSIVREGQMNNMVRRHKNSSEIFETMTGMIDDKESLNEVIEESILEVAAISKLRGGESLTDEEMELAAVALTTLGLYGEVASDPEMVAKFFGENFKELSEEQIQTFAKCVNRANELKGIDDHLEITREVFTVSDFVERLVEIAENPENASENDFEKMKIVLSQFPEGEIPMDVVVAANSFREATYQKYGDKYQNYYTGYEPRTKTFGDSSEASFAAMKLLVKKVGAPLDKIKKSFESIEQNQFCVGAHKVSVQKIIEHFPTKSEFDEWLDIPTSLGSAPNEKAWAYENLIPNFRVLLKSPSDIEVAIKEMVGDDKFNQEMVEFVLENIDEVIEDF